MAQMLSETKEEIQRLIAKTELLEFVIKSAGVVHKDFEEEANHQLKEATNHKLKLTSEILRLAGADKLPKSPVEVVK